MLLQALRAGVGEDKVIELRMSAEDGEPGGMTLEDTCGFAEQIDGLVDIFHVSNGIKKLGNGSDTFSDIFDVHGVNLERAAAIKRHLHKSLVSVVGGFNSVAQAEDAIASGKVDFVEYARQCFADPMFIEKTSTVGRTWCTAACAASTAIPDSASTRPTSLSGTSCLPRSS